MATSFQLLKRGNFILLPELKEMFLSALQLSNNLDTKYLISGPLWEKMVATPTLQYNVK